jgi:hypothetical protein
MNLTSDADWLPERLTNAHSHTRLVGVEIELAGVAPDMMAELVESLFGGKIIEKTRFEYHIKNTSYGDFKLELDSSYLKESA